MKSKQMQIAMAVAALSAASAANAEYINHTAKNPFAAQPSLVASTDTKPSKAPISHEPKAIVQPQSIAGSESQKAGETMNRWVVRIEDETIRKLLNRWAKEAGFELIWEADRDIQISATAEFGGTFAEALTVIIQSVSTSEYPIEAVVYSNNVVRIVKPGTR